MEGGAVLPESLGATPRAQYLLLKPTGPHTLRRFLLTEAQMFFSNPLKENNFAWSPI